MNYDHIRNITAQVLEKYTVVCGLNANNYWDKREIESINLASETDDSGISTISLVRGLYDKFISEKKYSAKYVIEEFPTFQAEMNAIRDLYLLTEDAEIVGYIQDFLNYVMAAASGYGMDGEQSEKLRKFLNGDKLDFAHVRLSALRGMRDLQQFQFLQGEPGKEPLRVNHYIYEFWNINSLVAAMRAQQVPGVSLCLLRDPEETMASYFVFSVSNGEQLTILTDRQDIPHPMYWKMARRPDRDMENRWNKHYFPYHLLKLKADTDENGNVKGYRAVDRTGLVPYQAQAIKLAPLASLYPDEFLWVTLMLDRINERFGVQRVMLPDIAYTGEMIVHPEVLAESSGALVRQELYKPLEMPKVTKADVTREMTAEQWERDASHFNDWIEERFKDNVPDAILNVMGEDNLKLLAAEHGFVSSDTWGKKTIEIAAMSPTTFGTKESLRKDQIWLARYNQMQHIQQQLEEEFKREEDNVIKWWQKRMEGQKERLVEAAIRMEFLTRSEYYSGWAGEGEETVSTANIVRVTTKHIWRDPAMAALSKWYRTFGNWGCYFRDRDGEDAVEANVTAVFKPNCPQALADLAGCAVDELPIWLQHWYTDEPYTGNSILDRLDPLDWVIDNPWMKLKFGVHVAFCKSEFHRARKALGLPFHRFKDEND